MGRTVTIARDHAQFCLASASPRRRELLTALGYRFTVMPADIDETSTVADPADRVVALAEAKAHAVASGMASVTALPVLAADTLVAVDGDMLGKPADADDAAAMLRRLSGRSHHVVSGVVLLAQGQVHRLSTTTEVDMAAWSDADIDAYWASGEPVGKAGGYAIQGLAAAWVRAVRGSYTGVVGLPLAETRALLAACGIAAPLSTSPLSTSPIAAAPKSADRAAST